ncbi:MAG: TAXI family TRAP transporter solute-binding subunit [Lachnospiraceae bacterium]|nr:TAXI family TRAP transporter solute-binding subunit [Lachnospiraceae bacterium]
MTVSVTACGGSGNTATTAADTTAASAAATTAADTAGATDNTKTEEGESKGLTPEERAKEFITVGTGPTSGIYFPIGGAFATALSDYGYQTSAEATNATGQNIQNILNGDAEIAIAMQDAVMQAYTATGAYEGKEPATGLKALMRLWPNYVQLVTTADTGITSVGDLKGKRVGVGAANSGVEINARMILNAYGITYDDITPDYLAYGEAIDNMKNGQCDAVFVTSGLPNATVMDLGVSYDMVVIPIDGEGREKLVNDYPYYAESVIPANTYNNTEDVEGVFVYNIMLVREDLSDDMVYDILNGVFENINTIKASHNAADKNIDITFGVDDIQLPLHPGAEAFWKDNGYIN